MDYKFCGYCHADRPVEAFAASGSRPDGLAASCRRCESVERKVLRLRNQPSARRRWAEQMARLLKLTPADY